MGENLSNLRAIYPVPLGASDERAGVRETPCDLCGETEFELAAHRDRGGAELPTVVCRVCGLVSHLAVPSDEELLRYYRRQYRYDYHGHLAPAPHRVVRAWRRGADLVRLLRPLLSSRDEVFEIGAGLGCTLKQFEFAGFAASGIDPGAAFSEFSRDRLAARVTPGVWSDLPPNPRYKLVLLVHVIEHLNSPYAALCHLKRLLAPGGYLYVECPNLYSPHAAPRRLFHPAHVYNFTPATLSMLARRCGYSVAKSFSGPRDRNLGLLLSRSAREDRAIDSDSYSQTIEALARYNSLTYHLRWIYLKERCRGLVRDLSDHWQAKRRLFEIAELCQSTPPVMEQGPQFERRAA